MRLRNYSHKTIKAYKSGVRKLVRHFAPHHPRELRAKDIRQFLLHLIDVEHWQASSVNQILNALRFLYVELYKLPFVLGEIRRPMKVKKLPNVLCEEEVLAILKTVGNLKHQTLLMLIYSGGLRVSEAVNLKIADIDSKRKMIRLEGAKEKKTGIRFFPKHF